MLLVEMARGADKIVRECACVKEGEKVLIVTDGLRPPSVAESLAVAARRLGAIPVVVFLPAARQPGEEPPAPVAAAMREADVILTPTTKVLYHTKAVLEARRSGARVLTLTECDEATLISGGVDADFTSIRPVVEEAARRLTQARTIRVTAPSGTDLTADIGNREGIANTAICDRPGLCMGAPDIEVGIAPLEESAYGKAAIDVTIASIGVVLAPVELTFENGRVVEISGGKEAGLLGKMLEAAGHPGSRVLAEIAVGLNPNVTIKGKIIEDEGAYGTGHFALGDNSGHGGASRAPVHIDMVFHHPTVELDGEVVFRGGVPLLGIPCRHLPGSE